MIIFMETQRVNEIPEQEISLRLSDFLDDNGLEIKDLHAKWLELASQRGFEAIGLSTLYTYTRKSQRIPSIKTLYRLITVLEELTHKEVSFKDLIITSKQYQLYEKQKQLEKNILNYQDRFSKIDVKYSPSSKKPYFDEEEITLLSKIEKIDDLPIKTQLLIKLGDIFYLWGNYFWAKDVYERAGKLVGIEIAANRDSGIGIDYKKVSREQVEVLARQSNIYKKIEASPKAFKICQLALDSLRLISNWSNQEFILESSLLRIQGDCLRRMGFKQSIVYYELALNSIEHLFGKEVNDLRGHINNGVGILLQESGRRVDEAIEYHRKALASFQASGNTRNKTHAQVHLANALYRKGLTVQENPREGLLREARRHIIACKKEFEKIGDRTGLGNAYFVEGLLNTSTSYRKDYKEAIFAFDRAYNIYKGYDSSENIRSQFYVLLLKAKALLPKAQSDLEEHLLNLEQAEKCLFEAEGKINRGLKDYRGELYLYINFSAYYLEKMKIALDSDRGKFRSKAKEYCQKTLECERKGIEFSTNLDSFNQDSEKHSTQFKEKYKQTGRDKYLASALLQLSYINLEEAKSYQKQGFIQQAHKSLDESFAHIIRAIFIFEDYDDQLNKGKCYMRRAEIIKKRAELMLEENEAPWLKRQYNYYSIAHKCFNKIDRRDWINKVEKELSYLQQKAGKYITLVAPY